MKLTAILLLISFSSFAQRQFKIAEVIGKGDTVTYINLVTKLIAPKDGMKIKFNTPPDTARLFMPDDGFQYILEGTFRKVGTTTPLPDVVTSIDNVVSESRNVYTPAAAWTHASGQVWNETYHNKTGSFSNVVNAALETTVDGYKIEFWSEKRVNHGLAAISIDGGAEVMVDLYDPTTGNNSQRVWTSADLVSGSHKIKIRVTGNKAPAATEASIIIDMFVVYKR